MQGPRAIAGRVGLALAVLLLVLRATAGEARVVQTPPAPTRDPAAQGGVALPPATPQAAGRGRSLEHGLGLPSAQLAWMMVAQMELLTQMNAAARLAIGDGHGLWRAPRILRPPFPARRFVITGKRRSGPLLPP